MLFADLRDYRALEDCVSAAWKRETSKNAHRADCDEARLDDSRVQVEDCFHCGSGQPFVVHLRIVDLGRVVRGCGSVLTKGCREKVKLSKKWKARCVSLVNPAFWFTTVPQPHRLGFPRVRCQNHSRYSNGSSYGQFVLLLESAPLHHRSVLDLLDPTVHAVLLLQLGICSTLSRQTIGFLFLAPPLQMPDRIGHHKVLG